MMDWVDRYIETMNRWGLLGEFIGIMSFALAALLPTLAVLWLIKYLCGCW